MIVCVLTVLLPRLRRNEHVCHTNCSLKVSLNFIKSFVHKFMIVWLRFQIFLLSYFERKLEYFVYGIEKKNIIVFCYCGMCPVTDVVWSVRCYRSREPFALISLYWNIYTFSNILVFRLRASSKTTCGVKRMCHISRSSTFCFMWIRTNHACASIGSKKTIIVWVLLIANYDNLPFLFCKVVILGITYNVFVIPINSL